MKAVRIHSFGGPEVLAVEEAQRPEPRDGEVLIRVRAAGVNPVDYKIRAGKFGRDGMKFPATLGREVSGVVEAAGNHVDGFKPGDEVFAFLGQRGGGYAEYAVADQSEVAPKPSSLDHMHAAAVPLAAETAWQGLFDQGKLKEGQTVLIHGAGGGVGHYAVQFAKACGARVIATGSQEDLDFLRELGADEVVDFREELFEDRVSGVDLVLDLVGGETQDRSWKVVKAGGRIVSTLEEPSKKKADERSASGRMFMAQSRSDQLRKIAQLIEDGKVVVHLMKSFPLAEVQRAHEALEHEHAQGKVVLAMGEPA